MNSSILHFNFISFFSLQAAYANFTGQMQQKDQQFHDNVTSNLAGQALQLFNQLWVGFSI
jgi:hypothetical protein